MNDKIVTDKFGIRLYPGDRVYATYIPGVTWSDPQPLEGTVHSYFGYNGVNFLPNEPDPSTNGSSNARKHQPYGWIVSTDNIEKAPFIIDELSIS